MRRETENVRRKAVKTQNETRENNMFVNNEEMKSPETPVGAQLGCAKRSRPEFAQQAALLQGAGKAALLLGAWLFAPQTALAQNECDPLDPPSADGATADTYTCDPQDYPGGITYSSDGDLTLEVPNDTADFRLLDDGVSVTGNGADNIFWDSSAFVSGEIVGDADLGTFDGAVLDYFSDTGDVDIVVGGDIKGQDNASHAIRAESTGGGDVRITTQGFVNDIFSSPDPSGIGIEALTTSGDIVIDASAQVSSGETGGPYAIHAVSSAGGNIDIDLVVNRAFAVLSRGTRGILAETTGSGNIEIDENEGISVSGVGGIGIEASTDTGDIAITTAGARGAGGGVLAQTGGNGTITLDVGASAGIGATAIQAIADTGDITIDARGASYRGSLATGIETQTDGLATINVTGGIRNSIFFSDRGNDEDAYAIRSSGNAAVVTLEGVVPPGFPLQDNFFRAARIQGAVDFSGLANGATVNIRAGNIWSLGGEKDEFASAAVSFFSDADDAINIDAGGFLSMPFFASGHGNNSPTVAEDTVTVQFGDGTDAVNNAGNLLVSPVGAGFNPRRLGYEAELRFENLTTFNNTGTVWLGADIQASTTGNLFKQATDLWPDDILAMPGATFHGGAGSRIVLDVDFNRIGQSACDAGQRNADGDLVADCVNIAGGVATGRTELVVRDMAFFDRGAYNPAGTVVVDLSGIDPAGTDPGAFVIGPDSDHYSPDQGGGIDKGLFFYTVAYEPDVQRFKLYGLPGAGAQELPLLAHVANDLWRTATDAWFERQVDQRDVDLADGRGGGFWFRSKYRDAERDVATPIVAGGETLVFDNSYSQEDLTIALGRDLVFRGAEGAWLAGAMIGYGRAQLDYDVQTNTADLEGPYLGLYGSFTRGDFYVDAAFNAAKLDIQNDVPNLGLKPEGTILSPEAESYGAQVEAGWRLRLGMLAVEPLAGLSYVTTSLDDLNIPADDPTRFGGEADFDDTVSSRGNVGVRVSLGDVVPGFAPTAVSLTARAIEEFDGEAKASIANVGPIDAPVTDTFDGTFGQVTGDVSITNAAKTAAGYLKVDAMTGDDYDSVGVSAGFRYQW